MPQILLLIAGGAALLLMRRYLKKEQDRIAEDLREAERAMERRDIETSVPLEQDPSTGVYRPKRTQ
jgi:hypothetical protein